MDPSHLWTRHPSLPLLPTAVSRIVAPIATSVGVVLALLLPDAMANAGLERQWLLLLGLDAGLLALTTRRFRLRREDLGFLVVAAATLWPHLVTDPFRPTLGGVGSLAVLYAIGRLGGLAPRSLGFVVLTIGAFHGVIAIAESVPALSSVVPFEPMKHGVVFEVTRATGLFNNPNTLGNLEAFGLIFAAVVGIGRKSLPLVLLCVVGLVLSSGRESVFGLLVGLCVLWFGPVRLALARSPASWTALGLTNRRIIIVVVVVAAVAFMAVAIFPTSIAQSSIARLNPLSFASDFDLLDRVHTWKAALAFVPGSPLVGYGSVLPVRVVDNAYLVWTLGGGVIGLMLWLGGLIAFTPPKARPLLAALFSIALLANPFAGTLLAAFLITCGAFAAAPTDAVYRGIAAATARWDGEANAAASGGAGEAEEAPSPAIT